MAEDQVVVGNKVEEPNVQLLCIVALRMKRNKDVSGQKTWILPFSLADSRENLTQHAGLCSKFLFLALFPFPRNCTDLRSAEQSNYTDACRCQLSAGHALKVGAHTHFTQMLQTFHLVHLGADQHSHGLQHTGWIHKHTQHCMRNAH